MYWFLSPLGVLFVFVGFGRSDKVMESKWNHLMDNLSGEHGTTLESLPNTSPGSVAGLEYLNKLTLFLLALNGFSPTFNQDCPLGACRDLSRIHDVIASAKYEETRSRRSQSLGIPVTRRAYTIGMPSLLSSLVSPISVHAGTGGEFAVELVYPSSILGSWNCHRKVVSVDGDRMQAESAWRLLGGSGFRDTESFTLKYVAQPPGAQRFRTMMISPGVVLDRGLEMKARTGSIKVDWDIQNPDTLSYQRDRSYTRSGLVELEVVQRRGKGLDSTELIRITKEGNEDTYMARVQRRFNLDNEDPRNPLLEGSELVEIFPTNSGILGSPISTIKSSITLRRPETE